MSVEDTVFDGSIPTGVTNTELLPSTPEQRTIGTGDLFVLCAGMVINVVGLIIPTQIYMAGGLSAVEVLITAFCGFCLVSCLITMTGDIGTRYGVPFTVFIRDCFGLKGAIVGSISRAIVCMTWCGVIGYLGASAIHAILEQTVGLSNFWVVFVIFMGLQLFNASRGVNSMSRFGWIAIPLLGIMLSAMVIWLLNKFNADLGTVLTMTSKPASPESFTFFGAISVFAGGWLSEALNGSDLSRKLKLSKQGNDAPFLVRNRSMIIAFFLGFVGTGLVLSGAGLIAGSLSGTYDPVEMIKASFADNTFILVVSCLTLVAAQWSTNTCANIFPATLILLNAVPKLSFTAATWIIGLLSCAMMPWLLLDHLAYVQIVFSSCLAPILAILLVHYYLVLKTQVNIDRLYDGSLPAWKANGLIALGIGIAGGVIFNQEAFFVAFPAAGISYYLLAKFRK